MNVGFMERLVQVLAGLAILFVGGTVAVTTVMPIRSGIQKVAVDSEIGRGSTFTIRLPVEDRPPEEQVAA